MVEPKVRFKQNNCNNFPAWTTGKLNSIAERVERKAPKGSTAPIMMVSQGNGFIYQTDKYSRENAGQSLKNYTLLRQGEFAYNHGASKAKPYGVAYCLVEEPEARVPFVYHTFRLTKGINSYWHEALNTTKMDRQLKRLVSSGARMDGLLNINYETYMNVDINIPCLEEQQKIADFLSSVDDVITASEEEVANLETQKKAVMKKIFSQEVRFKRPDGSEFPEWEEKTIGDVTDPLTGYAFESELFTKKGIRLLRGMNIKRGEIDFSEDICKYWPTSEGLEKFLLQENDLIVQMDGALVGKSFGLVKAEHLPALLVQRVTRLRGNSVIIQLLYQILSMGQFDKDMKLNQTSTAVPHISLKDITEYGICIPSDPEEQRLIAGFLSDFDKAIAAVKKELELWKELKKGLLQQMFV